MQVTLVAAAWSFKQRVLTCQARPNQSLLLRFHLLYACIKTRTQRHAPPPPRMCATQYEQQWCSFDSTSSSSLIKNPLDWRTQTRPPKVGKVWVGGWRAWPETDQSKQPHYHISCCYFPISSLSIRLQGSRRTGPGATFSLSSVEISPHSGGGQAHLPGKESRHARTAESRVWLWFVFHPLLPVFTVRWANHQCFDRKIKQEGT